MNKKRKKLLLPTLVFLLIGIIFVSIGIGRYSISPEYTAKILLSVFIDIPPDWETAMERIVLSIRLPRILAAGLVGSSLALAGAAFQGLFKNPLVSPDILGVSAGSGFGAALAILMGLNTFWIQGSALVFGLAAVGMAYYLKIFYKSQNALILVLAGIIISGFFSSGLSLIKYVADPLETLPAITFWLMGSLVAVGINELVGICLPILVCTTVLLTLRRKLNVLSLGDREARALGVNVERMQIIVVFCATVITASSICISGTIGWIGLVIPHLARLFTGVNHDRLLPASCLLGAIALILLDDVARTLSGAEIPLGILTGIIGTPIFAILLFKQRMKV